MGRKVSDCRKFPSESNCSLTISGEEEEVVRAASEHAVSVHGHTMSDELKRQIRGMLVDEGGSAAASQQPRKSPNGGGGRAAH